MGLQRLNKSCPQDRAVLEDYYQQTHNQNQPNWAGVVEYYVNALPYAAAEPLAPAPEAVAYADAAAYFDTNNDGVDAAAHAAANADAPSADADAARWGLRPPPGSRVEDCIANTFRSTYMQPGLYVFQVPGIYYKATAVGWLDRVEGDEWVIRPGARAILRLNTVRTMDSLAADGVGQDHKLGEPSRVPKYVHRFSITAACPVTSEELKAACPAPSAD